MQLNCEIFCRTFYLLKMKKAIQNRKMQKAIPDQSQSDILLFKLRFSFPLQSSLNSETYILSIYHQRHAIEPHPTFTYGQLPILNPPPKILNRIDLIVNLTVTRFNIQPKFHSLTKTTCNNLPNKIQQMFNSTGNSLIELLNLHC